MTPVRLAEILGELLGTPPGEMPAPYGSWEREAVYASAAVLRSLARRGAAGGRSGATPGATVREIAEETAVRLRARAGIAGVRVRPDGFLLIAVTRPGEIVGEIVRADGPPGGIVVAEPGSAGPDFPRTWDNPGFVIRYAHARAVAAGRWARDLGVPAAGFRPEALDDPYDLAVLRLLAELPSRAASRAPAWETYAEHLALAFHDAHEHAPAVPRADEPPGPVHTARLWLAMAVRSVLAQVLVTPLPDRL
ncbi:anticodon-binding protein [Sphaerimonospora sp. CA-214678]|uniref:anticodon-binding protein n=1 Tax=Sphaerimonospora sp. CA-214678 TaxID=3240029 RepID=UPI003D924FFA